MTSPSDAALDRPVIDVPLETVKAGLAQGSLTLIDVREPHEFAAGHVPGALSMPLSQFDPGDLPLQRGRIVLMCAAGVRSVHALMAARVSGLPLDEHFAGGFRAWLMAGEPVAFGDG
jgi:rhodanese-related sulfurtransferase